jgi:hypothetical protein
VQRLADAVQQASDAFGDTAEKSDMVVPVVVAVIVAGPVVAVVMIAGERQRREADHAGSRDGHDNSSFLQHEVTPFRMWPDGQTNNYLGKTRGALPIGRTVTTQDFTVNCGPVK